MISSKTPPETDDSEEFKSILQTGHRFLCNLGSTRILKKELQNVALMKGTKKLGENEDWEACVSTLQICHLFGRNLVQRDFYRKGFKLSIWW